MAPHGHHLASVMIWLRRPSIHGLWIVGLLSLGALVRWHNVGAQSLWLDELGQVVVARAGGASFFEGVRFHAGAAPLDYVGTKIAVDLLGFSTVAARIWPFLMGVLTILLVERLASEVSGSRRAGLAAACLAIPSAFLVFYSQEARFYSLSVATTVAALWTFARAERLRRWRDWVIFAGVATAALYTHYAFALLFVLMGAWLVLSHSAAWIRTGRTTAVLRDQARQLVPFALVTLTVALAFLPWYLFATRGQLASSYGFPPLADFTLQRAAKVVLTLLTGSPRIAPPSGRPAADWLLFTGILVLALLGLWRIVTRRPLVAGVMLSFAVLLIPITWVAAQRTHYFLSERHVIDMVPVVLILAACGVATILDRADGLPGRLPRVAVQVAVTCALVASLALLSAPTLGRVYAGEFFPREDWQGAAGFVRSTACPGGRVYTNLGAAYGYGIGLYAPELKGQIAYLQEENANEFLIDVLRRYPIGHTDIIVVFRERPGVYVPGRGTIDTISDYLAGQGFGYRTFTPRIRVFVPFAGCPSPTS